MDLRAGSGFQKYIARPQFFCQPSARPPRVQRQTLRPMQTAITRKPNWTMSQHLPRGARGTVKTLKLMAMFCKRDAGNTELRAVAQRIIDNTAGHDFSSEIRALFYFTRDHIKYRKDPVEVERVQDALRTLEFGSGDCDDKVTLLVTLLAVCGHRARFCVSGPAPGRWQHVYCEVATPNGWMPLDPTPEIAQPGWQTSAPSKGLFDIWPATSANIRVVRAALPKRQPQRQMLVAPCLGCDCDESGLGADVYEWKMGSSGECALEKKKCGLFCKIGRGFKTVGKVALAAAPLIAAPFTGGASLGLTALSTGAATAAAITTASVGALTSVLAQRQGVPQGAQIKDPEGPCAAWMQRKQQEEAAKAQQAAEAAAAASKSSQDALVKSKSRKRSSGDAGGSDEKSSSGGLFSQPLFIGALILGGVMLLRK